MDLRGDWSGGIDCGSPSHSVGGALVLQQAAPETAAGQLELWQRDEAEPPQHSPFLHARRGVGGTGRGRGGNVEGRGRNLSILYIGKCIIVDPSAYVFNISNCSCIKNSQE